MKSLGLVQVIDEQTRITSSNGLLRGSRLDLIFTNSMYVKEAKEMNLNLSDHLAVRLTRKKIWVKQKKISFRGRSYKNYVKEDFQEDLVNLNWGKFFEETDPDKLWEILRGAITKTTDPICPLMSFTVPEALDYK